MINEKEMDEMRVQARELVRQYRVEFELMRKGERNATQRTAQAPDATATKNYTADVPEGEGILPTEASGISG